MTKFERNLDEAVYKLTLDGGVDTFGNSVDGPAHYSRVEVPEDEVVDGVTVPAGLYVVIEDSFGFVHVKRWDLSEDDAEAQYWHLSKKEYEERFGDDEVDEEPEFESLSVMVDVLKVDEKTAEVLVNQSLGHMSYTTLAELAQEAVAINTGLPAGTYLASVFDKMPSGDVSIVMTRVIQ